MNRDRLTAQLIFYPTLGWNMLLARVLHIRRWWDQVHEYIILGALPMKRDVKRLAAVGVKAVVNTCEEYAGPVEQYAQHAIEQFRMPTVDFTHPKFADVERAVEFMDQQIAAGNKVYVHCKAGRARSATVVMCWMIKNLQQPASEIQKKLNYFRPHINQHLPERPVIQEFEAKYLKPG